MGHVQKSERAGKNQKNLFWRDFWWKFLSWFVGILIVTAIFFALSQTK